MCDKAFNFKAFWYDKRQRRLASSASTFFDKKSSGARNKSVEGTSKRAKSQTLTTRDKSAIIQNQLLTEELHESIIRRFEKRKVYSSIKDNILDVDLANMKLMSKCNFDSKI